MTKASLFPLLALGTLTVACESSRPSPSSAPSTPTSVGVPPMASASAEVAAPASDATASAPVPDSILPTAGETNSSYPIVDSCKSPQAVAKEKRSLPPRKTWEPITSSQQRLSFAVPPSVFKTTDDASGLVLTSSLSAPGPGPNAPPRTFSIRVRRVAKSIDELLADKGKDSPLGGVSVEDAFPKRNEKSFAPRAETTRGPGFALALTLANKPAYVFVNGAEGYDTDVSLLRAGARDTVVVVADWNSAIMGQPECWEQHIIAGVLDTFTIR